MIQEMKEKGDVKQEMREGRCETRGERREM